jgi:hypothetical protein
LAVREWEWDDSYLANAAIKKIGEDRVAKALNAVHDAAIWRYRDAWLNHRDKKTPSKPSRKEQMQAIGRAEIIAAAEVKDARNGGMFHGWGMRARKDDLEFVFERLLTAREPGIIANYLTIFSNCVVPRFNATLFLLCEHDDESVRRRAFRVVSQCTHPSIRDFAIAQFKQGVSNGSVVSLLIKNYQNGDERLLLDSLRLPDDQNELHWLLMHVIEVLEAHPEADCSRLAVIAYALTPCASCRSSAARHLHKQGNAPQWLIDECFHDAEDDTRQLYQTASVTNLDT